MNGKGSKNFQHYASFLGSMNMDFCISGSIFRGHHKISDLWIEGDWLFHRCHAALWIEGGVFFRDMRMEGSRGSGDPASHTRTFPDLVPPGPVLLFREMGSVFSHDMRQIVFPMNNHPEPHHSKMHLKIFVIRRFPILWYTKSNCGFLRPTILMILNWKGHENVQFYLSPP